jgi:hypothetical protein
MCICLRGVFDICIRLTLGESLLEDLLQHILGHGGLVEGQHRLGDAPADDRNLLRRSPVTRMSIVTVQYIRVLDVKILLEHRKLAQIPLNLAQPRPNVPHRVASTATAPAAISTATAAISTTAPITTTAAAPTIAAATAAAIAPTAAAIAPASASPAERGSVAAPVISAAIVSHGLKFVRKESGC